MENILKENQKIYDANQRKLNSLQLELVKSDNATWLHFFWGQSHLSKSQLVWILMIAITLRIENVILDLISADQCTQNEVIFLMPYVL